MKREMQPSPGELELLGLLWEAGPLSLSEVHTRMPAAPGYTTVQTRLNRLAAKGLARRYKEGRQPTKYEATVTPEQVGANQLESYVQHVQRGNVAPLVAHLVRDAEITADELLQLKAIVLEAEQKLMLRKGKR